MGIFNPDDLSLAGQHNNGIGTLQPRDRFDQGLLKSGLEVFDKKMQKNFTVHGGLKNGSGGFEFILEYMRIGKIAVVGHRIGFFTMVNPKGLGVGQNGAAGC